MIVKTLAHTLSPGGRGGRLSILIFHRVLSQPDPILNWDLDALTFERTVRWLKTWFNVLPLDQAIARLASQTLPARAAAITFDDGYADNCTVAMPILRQHGLTATFFIATGYLDGGRMWNDTVVEAVRNCRKSRLDLSDEGLGVHELNSAVAIRQAILSILNEVKYRDLPARLKAVEYVATVAATGLPADLMLTSEQVRGMRGAGMLIGAHTVTHPILARLNADAVLNEARESKQFLESLIQERVGLFAYPNGKPDVDYRAADAEIIRGLDFDAAVTTAWGVADVQCDRMQLPRFTPWDRTRLRFGARLVQNLWQSSRRRAEQRAH
ncbi:MAG: polysaccharide deacetylase family protein [Candidatus Accumulibacter sp. UW26]|jgi:peptidoglycan/xylan/chitin deacetylase (PgdA/CDA1 family)